MTQTTKGIEALQAELEQIRQALQASEMRFRNVIEHNADGIVVLDKAGTVRFVNTAAEELLLRTSDELVGEVLGFPLIPEEITELDIVHSGKRVKIAEMRIVETEWEGESALLASLRDITRRAKMEKTLRQALEQATKHEAEVSALLKGSRAILHYQNFEPAAQAIFDACKDLLHATSGYVALLNEEGTENDVLFLDPGGLPCTVDPALPMPIRGLRAQAYRTGLPVYHNDFAQSEWVDLMPKGHVELRNVLFAPLNIGNQAVGLLGLANKEGGFTEEDAHIAQAFGELAAVALRNSLTLQNLEKSEGNLRDALKQREVLLQEIHHRVKNNFQIVHSMLEFQTDTFEDEALLKVLRDSQRRLQSMALIHEQLYRAPDLARIDFAIYIQALANDLFETYRLNSNYDINLHLDVHDVVLEVKKAVPCGLIINELVSNALKYAFPLSWQASANTKGEIHVVFHPSEQHQYILSVSDNGIGLPPDFEEATGESLGIFLVNTFTHQLGGQIEWENAGGTTCRIVFTP